MPHLRLGRWLALLLLGIVRPAWSQVSLIHAIEATLARHPQLEIQRERVLSARSFVKQAAGQFDTQLGIGAGHSLTHTPLTGLQQLQVTDDGLGASNMTSNATTTSGSATRLLSNGIQLSTSASISRNTDNLVDTHGVNLSQLRFQVNIPLLRGRGRDVATAELNAARIESDASLFDLNYTASSLISDTVTQYWQVVAARQAVRVFAEAEERGRVLVANVRTLIDAERLPRAELQQVLANLANRTSARAAAEQRLVEATQALAFAMGVPASEMMTTLDPSDALPDGETAPLPSMMEADVTAWLRRSLTRRADYRGLQQRQAAFGLRRDAAADKLKPQLDFHIGAGYSGLREGRRPDQFLFSPFSNVGGLDVIAGVSYGLPIGRRTAEAQLEQANSGARQNRLGTEDLGRSITSSVLAGIGAYKSAIIRTQQARVAVDVSQAALDGEREKLRLGAGSVVDVVTLEDRLTTALSALVDAGLNYAVLIARLRFATGTIIDPDRMAQTVDRAIFYRPPWEDPK